MHSYAFAYYSLINSLPWDWGLTEFKTLRIKSPPEAETDSEADAECEDENETESQDGKKGTDSVEHFPYLSDVVCLSVSSLMAGFCSCKDR